MPTDPVALFKANFEVVKRDPKSTIGGFAIPAVLGGVLSVVIGKVPVVGPMVSGLAMMLVMGALMPVYTSMMIRVLEGGQGDLSAYKSPHPLMVPSIILQLIMGAPGWMLGLILGLVAFVPILGMFVMLLMPIFGIAFAVLSIFLLFAPLILVESNAAPMDAIKKSVEVVKAHLMPDMKFFIVLFVANFVGALLLGIGLLVTVPVSILSAIAMYREWTGAAPRKKKGGTGRPNPKTAPMNT